MLTWPQTLSRLLAIALAPLASLHADPAVELTLQLDHDTYRTSREQNIYVDAQIKSIDADAPNARLPINLCLVVDRSGSMAGPKIEYAKSALLAALETLGPSDTYSVVTFGSEVETLVPAQRVDRLQNLASSFERIEAIGGTALYDAINQGAAQLRRYRAPDSVNRMILLSDGPPSRGPRELEDFGALARLLAQDSISISAIGLGQDFHEDILSSLSSLTRGSYYFAPQGQELADAIQKEVSQLHTVVARNLRLEVKLNNRAAINETLGATEPDIKRNVALYEWDALYANQNLRVILSATLGADGAQELFNPIAKATLTYTPVANPSSEPLAHTAEAKAHFADSQTAIERSANLSTLRHAYSLEIARSMKEAIAFADEGKIKKGLKELKGTLSDLRFINYELEDEVIDASINDLQAIYDRLNNEGFSLLDRKILTSRIANAERHRNEEADTPAADED